jgi:hypothetical protein
MYKSMSFIGILLLSVALNAQQIKPTDSQNPFSALEFTNGSTDTMTVNALFAGRFGELGEYNVLTLQSIHKVYGLNIKKINYAIAFTLIGNMQIFYMPSCDKNLFNVLTTKPASVNYLRLKCVVYRFYTLDGDVNFFYIEHAVSSTGPLTI